VTPDEPVTPPVDPDNPQPDVPDVPEPPTPEEPEEPQTKCLLVLKKTTGEKEIVESLTDGGDPDSVSEGAQVIPVTYALRQISGEYSAEANETVYEIDDCENPPSVSIAYEEASASCPIDEMEIHVAKIDKKKEYYLISKKDSPENDKDVLVGDFSCEIIRIPVSELKTHKDEGWETIGPSYRKGDLEESVTPNIELNYTKYSYTKTPAKIDVIIPPITTNTQFLIVAEGYEDELNSTIGAEGSSLNLLRGDDALVKLYGAKDGTTKVRWSLYNAEGELLAGPVETVVSKKGDRIECPFGDEYDESDLVYADIVVDPVYEGYEEAGVSNHVFTRELAKCAKIKPSVDGIVILLKAEAVSYSSDYEYTKSVEINSEVLLIDLFNDVEYDSIDELTISVVGGGSYAVTSEQKTDPLTHAITLEAVYAVAIGDYTLPPVTPPVCSGISTETVAKNLKVGEEITVKHYGEEPKVTLNA
jgi:hypothetical protein